MIIVIISLLNLFKLLFCNYFLNNIHHTYINKLLVSVDEHNKSDHSP